MLLTTTELVASVRRTAMLPTANANALTDADVLAETQRALEASVVPYVARVAQEYFVLHQSYPVQQNQARLTVPRRAMGNTIRDMFLDDRQSSGPTNPGTLTPMQRLRPEQAYEWRSGSMATPTQGKPRCFYMEGANIAFAPYPATPVWVRFGITVRPGNMVLPAAARQVLTVIQPTPTTVTVTWAGALSVVSGLVDMIASGNPHEYLGLNIIGTVNSTTSMTLNYAQETANSLLRLPEVGDWLTIAGQSPVIQLPSEAQQLLVQRGAEYCLRFLGYLEEASAAKSLGDSMEGSLSSVFSDRTPGTPRKVVGGIQKLVGRSWGAGRNWY